MTESVLISIRPKWCELIESGRKTIEVRKTRPKIDAPFKCYIYCTMKTIKTTTFAGDIAEIMYKGCGKVIGEFVCDEMHSYEAEFTDLHLPVYDPQACLNAIYEIWRDDDGEEYRACVASNENSEDDNSRCELFNESCLAFEEIRKYVGEGFTTEFFGWHISELVIYDTPKELSEFKGLCKYMDRDCCACPYYDYNIMDCKGRSIKRPPQSWCYVEEKDGD